LQCEAPKLSVTELGNNAYGVVGCDKRATYLLTCKSTFAYDCTAVMNSSQQPGAK
jgi:hypothetical protein